MDIATMTMATPYEVAEILARLDARGVDVRGVHSDRRASDATVTVGLRRRGDRVVAGRVVEAVLPYGWRKRVEAMVGAMRRARREPPAPTLGQRLARRCVSRALAEAPRRGLSLPVGCDVAKLRLVERSGGVSLVAGEWYHKYSSRAGTWRVGVAILHGRDDAGEWAIRVPASTRSVRAALAWATPADARRRIVAGDDWRRQGDLLLVRSRAGGWVDATGRPAPISDTELAEGYELGRHVVRRRADGTHQITHPEHRCMRVPAGGWRVYQLRQDSGASGGGD